MGSPLLAFLYHDIGGGKEDDQKHARYDSRDGINLYFGLLGVFATMLACSIFRFDRPVMYDGKLFHGLAVVLHLFIDF